ncbi:hypothetical protein GEMRC1_012667 [Eukaryota sp. GEM-RC1]
MELNEFAARLCQLYFLLRNKFSQEPTTFSISFSDYYQIFQDINFSDTVVDINSSNICFNFASLYKELVVNFFSSLQVSLLSTHKPILYWTLLFIFYPAETACLRKTLLNDEFSGDCSVVDFELLNFCSSINKRIRREEFDCLFDLISYHSDIDLSQVMAVQENQIFENIQNSNKLSLVMTSSRFNFAQSLSTFYNGQVNFYVVGGPDPSFGNQFQHPNFSKFPFVLVNVHINPRLVTSILSKIYDRFTSDTAPPPKIVLLSELQSLPSHILNTSRTFVLDQHQGFYNSFSSSLEYGKQIHLESNVANLSGTISLSVLVCLWFSVLNEHSYYAPVAFSRDYDLSFTDLKYVLSSILNFVSSDDDFLDFSQLDWEGIRSCVADLFLISIFDPIDCTIARTLLKSIVNESNCHSQSKIFNTSSVLFPSFNSWPSVYKWLSLHQKVFSQLCPTDIWLSNEVVSEHRKARAKHLSVVFSKNFEK